MDKDVRENLQFQLDSLNRELESLKSEIRYIDKKTNEHSERIIKLEANIKHIKEKVDNIDQNIGKFKWLLISTVILAIMNMVLLVE